MIFTTGGIKRVKFGGFGGWNQRIAGTMDIAVDQTQLYTLFDLVEISLT